MIPVNTLQAVAKILTHKKTSVLCADGVASAMILHQVYPSVPIEFLEYESPEHENLPAAPGLLLCDLTPPQRRIGEFVDAGAIVLDHHRSMKAEVARFGDRGVFGDEAANPGTSGASLAYSEVFEVASRTFSEKLMFLREHRPHEWLTYSGAVAELALLAGIRDTWQTHHPRWIEACALEQALLMYPLEYLLELPPQRYESLRDTGYYLYLNNQKAAKSIASKAAFFDLFHPQSGEPLRVALLSTTHVSDAAELLRQEADLIVGFKYVCPPLVDGRRVEEVIGLSLRAGARHRLGIDVGALAKRYGGGGHTKAAGCKVYVKPGVNVVDQVLETLLVALYPQEEA